LGILYEGQEQSSLKIFKKFATRAQNEFDVKIKRVRSDNGTEFKNTNIEEYLDEEGIGHELSIPYTPQQNGIVERKNRTLIQAARTMLDEYKTFRIVFGWKQSTRLVMLSTVCIFTSFVTKPPMNF
jgi:transposase InsO family protein